MIPRAPAVDSSLQFLGDGYRYLSRTADRLGVDAFRTRIALRPVLVLRGADGARFFYEGGRFDRKRAMPPTVVHLLQDRGSVQTLEDGAHLQRKGGFVDLLTGSAEQRLTGIALEEFSDSALRWRGQGEVTMHDELPMLFARIALRWAGVPPERHEVEERGPELWSMVQNAGSFGPGVITALLRRRRTERWARELIRDVRAGTLPALPGTALAAVAEWEDERGDRLPVAVAAVELLNLLRPIVAVALFVEFALLAMVHERGWREAFRDGDYSELDGFVHEVRRRAPFFPVIAGRARRDLDWQGDTVPEGSWVMLDLYGTNHDPRMWPHPQRFDPTRYRTGRGDARHIVAQGTGDYRADHRCPGEPATEALIAAAIRGLAGVHWHPVAGHSLEVEWSRLPAKVRGGLVLAFR